MRPIIFGLAASAAILIASRASAQTEQTSDQNYQSMNGVMMPTLISQFSPDDGTVRKLTSVDQNASIEASRFVRPEK